MNKRDKICKALEAQAWKCQGWIDGSVRCVNPAISTVIIIGNRGGCKVSYIGNPAGNDDPANVPWRPIVDCTLRSISLADVLRLFCKVASLP